MRVHIAATSVMLVAVLALAACGGSGPAATAGGEPAATAAPAAPSADTPATEQPSAPEAPAETTAGGATGSGDVCGLVTADEMAGILGKSPVKQGFFPGPPDTCDYQVDGAPLAAIVLMGEGAGMVYEAMKADPASEEFSGLGDRALFNSQTQTFLVAKGDRLLTIAITDIDMTDAQRLDAMKAAAKIAADRM